MYEVGLASTHDVPLLPDVERRACALFVTIPALDGIPLDVTELEELAVGQQAGLLWVARDGGRPIGFALVEPLGDGLHLEELDVLPEHGGKGVGRALLRKVCRYAAARRQALTLTTFRDVPWNAPFYSRAGFRILEAGELSPALAERMADEAARGLGGTELRVAMRFDESEP